MRGDLPSGTVTFLFTDVEGSTRLLDELGAEGYAAALAEHRWVLREAFVAHGGVEVDTQGDAFFYAFPTAPGALAAAAEALEGLAEGPIRVRIGIHTGTPFVAEEGYVGADVHRAARIAAAGHGGQVLVSASTAALVQPSNSLLLGDLGEHRLKDLSAPERIYQLGDGEFPPLKSLHQTNLPVPATPFLGRERELEEVLGLLSREEVRLLTLTGTGGTGKTRLALQAAGGLADRYPDGVWWVPLAALRDPSLVLPSAAQALGARDGLADHIGDKSLLLLFDNLEHLVEAAAELAGLLSSCPRLDLLVTSREPLHLSGEQEYPVPPLAHEEGIAFFLARASAVKPDFHADEAVPEICRRLDELPLALELAAVRVKALSPAQILQRLQQRLPLLTGGARDLPERQRTLRATIEWSHDLLPPEEQRLFRRLAVFRGGCALEAAEQVAEADLDTLQSLVDKSLLRVRDGNRYWMLETIREYAAERLEKSGDVDELRHRHAEFFLALAEQAEPHLRGNPGPWLDRLETEHDNLRAALDNLVAAAETRLVLELSGLLWRFWARHAHLTEGYGRLTAALTADSSSTPERARALIGAAAMAQWQGDTAATARHAREALTLHEEFGDPWGVALSSFLLADEPTAERDWARAREMYERCLRSFSELGDDHHTLMARRALAWMCVELGERDLYVALTEENLRLARSTGNKRYEALCLAALAGEARDEGRFDEALSMLVDAYRIHRDLGERVEIAVVLARFARAFAAAGRAEVAVRLLASSEEERERLGAGLESWVAEKNSQTRELVLARLTDADFAVAWEQGRDLTPDDAFALVMDIGSDV